MIPTKGDNKYDEIFEKYSKELDQRNEEIHRLSNELDKKMKALNIKMGILIGTGVIIMITLFLV